MINKIAESIERELPPLTLDQKSRMRRCLENEVERYADGLKDRAVHCALAAGELPEEGRTAAKYLEAKASVLRSVASELSADIIPF